MECVTLSRTQPPATRSWVWRWKWRRVARSLSKMLLSVSDMSILSRTWTVDIGAQPRVRNDGVAIRTRVLAGRWEWRGRTTVGVNLSNCENEKLLTLKLDTGCATRSLVAVFKPTLIKWAFVCLNTLKTLHIRFPVLYNYMRSAGFFIPFSTCHSIHVTSSRSFSFSKINLKVINFFRFKTKLLIAS